MGEGAAGTRGEDLSEGKGIKKQNNKKQRG
jgi:hypothetical protein